MPNTMSRIVGSTQSFKDTFRKPIIFVNASYVLKYYMFTDEADVQQGKLRAQITANEGELAGLADLDTQWTELEVSIEKGDKRRKGMVQEIDEASYDKRLQEFSVQVEDLEAQREALTAELQALSSDAAERGRLISKQEQLLLKEAAFTAKNEECSSKLRTVLGVEAVSDIDTMAEGLDRILL